MTTRHRLTIQLPATMKQQLDKACRSYGVEPDALIRSLLEYYFKLDRANGAVRPRTGRVAA